MKKVIAGVGLGFICMVSPAETIDFTAMGGYADGMLKTHSDWNGNPGFRVNAEFPGTVSWTENHIQMNHVQPLDASASCLELSVRFRMDVEAGYTGGSKSIVGLQFETDAEGGALLVDGLNDVRAYLQRTGESTFNLVFNNGSNGNHPTPLPWFSGIKLGLDASSGGASDLLELTLHLHRGASRSAWRGDVILKNIGTGLVVSEQAGISFTSSESYFNSRLYVAFNGGALDGSGIGNRKIESVIVQTKKGALSAEMRHLAVDFSISLGRFRALHGVNNGPVPINNRKGPYLTPYYKEASIPDCRLHDANWTGSNVADIPFIFPLAHLDPADPRNYLFARTDDYLQGIVNAGAEIVYRLGVSIEHPAKRYDTHPPADFNHWADVCLGIIRHYNEGWAGGFQHDIRYWEIWNEPGNSQMWSGTMDQYHELYKITAHAIKKQDASLKVGGPAGVKPALLEDFLAYCRDQKVPLDFCSQHAYNAKPLAVKNNAILTQKALDQFGFSETELFITEWHYWNGSWSQLYDYDDPEYHAAKFAELNGPAGAAFTAATLLMLQDTSVDRAHYYSGDTEEWGMFDPNGGTPRKPYYAMKAFGRLLDTPFRVGCSGGNEGEGLVLGAGWDAEQKTAQLLLVNFESPSKRFLIDLKNLPWTGAAEVDIFLVDADKNLELILEETLAGSLLEVECPAPALLLIRLTATE